MSKSKIKMPAIKYKKVSIPAGWVELEPGEIIKKEHKFSYHYTEYDMNGNAKRIFSKFVSPKDYPRYSMGEKYHNKNFHHYLTIKPAPKPIEPEFVINTDDIFNYHVTTNSVEQKNKLVDVCMAYGLKDKSAKKMPQALDIIFSIKSNKISWNYAGNSKKYINHNYGISLDINTEMDKIMKVLEYTRDLHKPKPAPIKYKYSVCVKEVHTVEVEVEAENEEQARELAKKEIESGDIDNLEYSHTLPSDEWGVNKIDNK